jgi:hypothetical protein
MKWSDIPRNPDARTLRQFGGMCVLFFGGLALYGSLVKGNVTGPVVFGLAAAAAGVLALVNPMLLSGVFVGWMILAFPIGFVISKLILAAVFLLVFTPVALTFRLIGRDALGLRRKPGKADTYWMPKSQPADPGRYLKQY